MADTKKAQKVQPLKETPTVTAEGRRPDPLIVDIGKRLDAIAKGVEMLASLAAAAPAEPEGELINPTSVMVLPPIDIGSLDVTDPATLQAIADSARAHSAKVGQLINPTSVFALRYENLAEVCEKLIELIAERGHVGVNQ